MSDKPVKRLPMLPLRGLTIFPYLVLHFDVGRARSIAALEEAMVNNQEIFGHPKDIKIEEPEIDDIYEVGTISKLSSC